MQNLIGNSVFCQERKSKLRFSKSDAHFLHMQVELWSKYFSLSHSNSTFASLQNNLHQSSPTEKQVCLAWEEINLHIKLSWQVEFFFLIPV